jgi:hypothetical protein
MRFLGSPLEISNSNLLISNTYGRNSRNKTQNPNKDNNLKNWTFWVSILLGKN